MEAGNFKRYLWVQSEEKRRANREKYNDRKKFFEQNYVEQPDPPKRNEFVWPGEFEDQLRKRRLKMENQRSSLEQKLPISSSSTSTTPTDEKNLVNEDEIANVNNEDSQQNGDGASVGSDPNVGTNNGRVKPEGNEHEAEKAARNKLKTKPIFPNYTFYSDDFLEPPKSLSSATSASVFLVASNFVNK